MTTTILLRPASPADHDTIADIWHASASLPDVGPPVMPSRDDLRRRVDEEFADGWDVTLAMRGGEAVGFLALKPARAVLAELFIRPGALGSGIGRQLFDHATATMPQGFTLHTRPGNERARRFYEQAGMIAIGEDIHPRSGDPIIRYGWKPRGKA